MRKRIYFIVISAIILIFAITMGFVIDLYLKIDGVNNFILYVIAKCVFCLAFIGMVIRGLFKKDTANYFLQYLAVVIAQIVPLFVRLLSHTEYGFIISMFIFFVSIILLALLIFGLSLLSRRTVAAQIKLQGKITEITENKEVKGD